MTHYRFLASLLLISLPSLTQSAPPPQDWQSLRQQAQHYLSERVNAEDAELRAQVEMGPVDPRLRMAQCGQPVFFLPPGTRLHGNGSLGVRCEAPEPWTVYISFSMTLQGPALVAKGPLGTRQAVSARDVELRRITYEGAPGDYLRQVSDLDGALLSRPVAAGQPLTRDRLMRQQSVSAGQKVKILLEGTGFQITQEGVALNGASPGEAVRVRASNGKVLQGVATADGRVRMSP